MKKDIQETEKFEKTFKKLNQVSSSQELKDDGDDEDPNDDSTFGEK
jgi:hypothetical protein